MQISEIPVCDWPNATLRARAHARRAREPAGASSDTSGTRTAGTASSYTVKIKMIPTSRTKSFSATSKNTPSSQMSIVDEVRCPVCFRVVPAESLKRHWSQSRRHKAIRPYRPDIPATGKFSRPFWTENQLLGSSEITGRPRGGGRGPEARQDCVQSGSGA